MSFEQFKSIEITKMAPPQGREFIKLNQQRRVGTPANHPVQQSLPYSVNKQQPEQIYPQTVAPQPRGYNPQQPPYVQSYVKSTYNPTTPPFPYEPYTRK